MKIWFLPTKSNNYTPRLLKRQSIILYTLFLLIFNILTAHINIFRAYASVDSTSLFELHNKARIEHNLQPLKLNSKLMTSAYNKATAMLESNCWDHYCPNGKSPWDFFDDSGYEYIYAGENLAEGFTNNEKVFNAWMNSKTHRENILRQDFNEIGIAIVYGDFQGITNNAIIVVHFGSRNYKEPQTNVNNTSKVQYDNKTSDVQITNPKDDEILNIKTPEIRGKSPDGILDIKDNDTTIGESIAQNGIFIYRIPSRSALKDGEHKIEVIHRENRKYDNINILIDTTPPIINDLRFNASNQKKEKEEIILSVTTSDDTLSLQSPNLNTIITRVDDIEWEIRIDGEIFHEIQNISLTAFDKANNKTEKVFDLRDVKNTYNNLLLNYTSNASPLGIIQKLDLRRIVNSIFILFILLIIIIDYYALKNTALSLDIVRAKTHYHFSMFLILFLISIIGGTAGELLTAQSL